jgi:prevent-host-death family protein
MSEVTVDIREAKTRLSRLVKRVEAGDDVVIARGGLPVARLVRYRATTTPRTPGIWRGQVRLARDFDPMTNDLLDAFGT